MISLLDPHTHTYKLAAQADHVSDAEVCRASLYYFYVYDVNLRDLLLILMIAKAES
jgi:hypothetical protein